MPHTRRGVLAGGIGLLASNLAGCIGGGGGSQDETNGTANSTTQAGGTPAIEPAATVEMADTSFDPVTVSVDPESFVEWVNRDGISHTVVSDQFSDASVCWTFETEDLGEGDTDRFYFAETGVYEYYCDIHGRETMCGAVLVGDVEYDETNLPCVEAGATTGGSDDGGGGGGSDGDGGGYY
ncbi:plastocyanin/azurin family copper-binding protein [Halobacteriaceae archaeon GCM10025711]